MASLPGFTVAAVIPGGWRCPQPQIVLCRFKTRSATITAVPSSSLDTQACAPTLPRLLSPRLGRPRFLSRSKYKEHQLFSPYHCALSLQRGSVLRSTNLSDTAGQAFPQVHACRLGSEWMLTRCSVTIIVICAQCTSMITPEVQGRSEVWPVLRSETPVSP